MAQPNNGLHTSFGIVRMAAPGGRGRIAGFSQPLAGGSANFQCDVELGTPEGPSHVPRHRMSPNEDEHLNFASRPSTVRAVSAPNGQPVSLPPAHAEAAINASDDHSDAFLHAPEGASDPAMPRFEDGSHPRPGTVLVRRTRPNGDAIPSKVNAQSAYSSMTDDVSSLLADVSLDPEDHLPMEVDDSQSAGEAREANDSSNTVSAGSAGNPLHTNDAVNVGDALNSGNPDISTAARTVRRYIGPEANQALLRQMNEPMRRIMQNPVLLGPISQALHRLKVREMCHAVVHRPPGQLFRSLPSSLASADWLSWLAAWYILLQTSDADARRLNCGLCSIRIPSLDCSIFRILSLDEMIVSLPRLRTITFEDPNIAIHVEMLWIRKGQVRRGCTKPFDRDTLFVTDSSFPAGTLHDILSRQTRVPKTLPFGWRLIPRTACDLEGDLGDALATEPTGMALANRMSTISTSRPWPYEDLHARLVSCTQGCRLIRDLGIDRVKLHFEAYTLTQITDLCVFLFSNGIGIYSINISMSAASPSSCSLYDFLGCDFWYDIMWKDHHFVLSLWAGEVGSAAAIATWVANTKHGRAIFSYRGRVTLRLHLPADSSGPAGTARSSYWLGDTHAWMATHWLMVDFLVRAMRDPSAATLVYISHPLDSDSRVLKMLRAHFRIWWLSLKADGLAVDDRLRQWKLFSRCARVASTEESAELMPTLRSDCASGAVLR